MENKIKNNSIYNSTQIHKRGIHLTKYMQYLYTENYKIPLNEIKDINGDAPCSRSED